MNDWVPVPSTMSVYGDSSFKMFSSCLKFELFVAIQATPQPRNLKGWHSWIWKLSLPL